MRRFKTFFLFGTHMSTVTKEWHKIAKRQWQFMNDTKII